MKMRSLKTMGWWFALASMTHSGALLAHCDEPHHSHCDLHHCEISLADACTLRDRASAAYHTLIGNVNDIFIAQASAVDPTAPPGSFLSRLIAAENGTGVGSNGEAIVEFSRVLRELVLGKDRLLVKIAEQLANVNQSAIDYGTAVSIVGGDPGSALTEWQTRGVRLAELLTRLSEHLDSQKILGLVESQITNQSNAALGFNGDLPGSPFEDQLNKAVEFDFRAHGDASELVKIIIRQLIKDKNHHECPCLE